MLWVVDATSPEAEWGSGRSHEVGAEPGPSAGGHKLTWLVRNKADLLPRPASPREQKNEHTSVEAVYDRKTEHIFILSAETGSGLEICSLRALTRQAEQAFGRAEPAVITRERHRLALQDAEAALARACSAIDARNCSPRSSGWPPARSAADWPGRRRGRAGRHFPRFLHREMMVQISAYSMFHVKHRSDDECFDLRSRLR